MTQLVAQNSARLSVKSTGTKAQQAPDTRLLHTIRSTWLTCAYACACQTDSDDGMVVMCCAVFD